MQIADIGWEFWQLLSLVQVVRIICRFIIFNGFTFLYLGLQLVYRTNLIGCD